MLLDSERPFRIFCSGGMAALCDPTRHLCVHACVCVRGLYGGWWPRLLPSVGYRSPAMFRLGWVCACFFHQHLLPPEKNDLHYQLQTVLTRPLWGCYHSQKFNETNNPTNQNAAEWPLMGARLTFWMWGAPDSGTCMRRRYCDAIGGQNVPCSVFRSVQCHYAACGERANMRC